MVTRTLFVCALCALPALGLAALGCTAVVLGEDPATGCADGIDNDGDGVMDAADPDCTSGGESTMDLCRNNLDDDGDSTFDCEDVDCIMAGFCDAYANAMCDVLLPPGTMRCPRGMACYLVGGMSECRLTGDGTERRPCRVGGYGPRDAYDCAADFQCNTYDTGVTAAGGMCQRFCDDRRICEPFGYCNENPAMTGDLSVCRAPCDPRTGRASGCPTGWHCISGHELTDGTAYLGGGAFFQCANDTIGRLGSAAAGAACVDGPTAATSLTSVCAPGLACIPNAGGMPFCRIVCDASAGTGCGGAETCTPLSPGTLGQVGYLGINLGVCLP